MLNVVPLAGEQVSDLEIKPLNLKSKKSTIWRATKSIDRWRHLCFYMGPTSSWRPFGPLDFVLGALQELRPVRQACLRSGPPFVFCVSLCFVLCFVFRFVFCVSFLFFLSRFVFCFSFVF